MAHVLLVDDDIHLLEANTIVLSANKHQVTHAHSGVEARELLKTLRPDLVVLDVMMEDFDSGFELAKYISASFPDLPMIMLTGVYEYMDDAWKQAFDEDKSWLPVHRFMEKPVSPTVLLYEIESLLKDKRH
ncbi:MAG TPA: response regulator [Elusimicrobiales bacterium]|mgnify:CR=1 FL=1|nr:response regulator [Elusimicrobiales bacterium]